MTGTRPADILRHFEQAGAEATGDGDLLARFARHRDQAAFALLVRRHGQMVLAVCRRITNHPQDAEDAFQAVFLVLARKAAALGRPELLGNWLYGVAVRVARNARRSAARRRAREVQAVDIPEPAALPADPPADVRPVVHEELARLPVGYREAVVLCDLRGVSRAEAAKLLGIPEGTLSSRLAGGRKKLAERLVRRGVAISVAAIPTAIGEARGTAAVPDSLVLKTCGLVADWASGAAVPGPVLRLADGGLPVRKVMLLGLFTTVLTAAGVVFAARSDEPPKPNDPAAMAEPAVAAVPDPKGDEKARGFTTKPKLRMAFDLPVHQAVQVVWSPDGKDLAVRNTWLPKGETDKLVNEVLYYSGLLTDQHHFETINLPSAGTLVGFTPDSKELITDRREGHLVSGLHQLHFWQVRPAPWFTGEFRAQHVRTVDLDPEQTHGYALAPDGKTYRTLAWTVIGSNRYGKIEVREVSTQTGARLKTLSTLDGTYTAVLLSGDGRRLVTGTDGGEVAVYEADGGKKLWAATPKLEAIPGSAGTTEPRIATSVDGKVVVVTPWAGRPVLLNGDTGKPLPSLEKSDLVSVQPEGSSFSADGRLMAVVGTSYVKAEAETPPTPPYLSDDPPTPPTPTPLPAGPPAGRGKRGAPPASTAVRSDEWFLNVWDTRTGKLLKSWHALGVMVAFHPTKPVLAVLEQNGEGGTRLGLWDFSAEVAPKK